jgi:hypothetical protein
MPGVLVHQCIVYYSMERNLLFFKWWAQACVVCEPHLAVLVEGLPGMHACAAWQICCSTVHGDSPSLSALLWCIYASCFLYPSRVGTVQLPAGSCRPSCKRLTCMAAESLEVVEGLIVGLDFPVSLTLQWLHGAISKGPAWRVAKFDSPSECPRGAESAFWRKIWSKHPRYHHQLIKDSPVLWRIGLPHVDEGASPALQGPPQVHTHLLQRLRLGCYIHTLPTRDLVTLLQLHKCVLQRQLYQ